jgi:hypothetical protein
MNAQLKEVLVFQGKKMPMSSEPLDQYLSKLKSPPRFTRLCIENKRGYLGQWTIENNELYLTELIGAMEDGKELTLESLFPGEQAVFAEWYTGEIILTQGKILALPSKYSPAVYERDLHLEFLDGLLICTYIVENTRDSISGFYDNMQHGGARVHLARK